MPCRVLCLYEVAGEGRQKRAVLSPEAKYFLAGFVRFFWREDCAMTVKELARDFAMSDRKVSSALRELKDAGFVAEVAQQSVWGSGRSRQVYRLTGTFRQRLEWSDSQEQMLGIARCGAVKRLLPSREERTDSSSGRGGSFAGLDFTDRLLLGVLLCCANHFGEVRNQGTADLCLLVGVNGEVLKRRIKALCERGFIRSYVPGASSQVLFGKTSSVYVINLSHSLFVGAQAPFTKLIHVSTIEKAAALDQRQALGLYRKAGWLKGIETPRERKVFAQIGSFFRQQERRTVAPILQYRLESYASEMLSKAWLRVPLSGLGRDFNLSRLMPELRARIEADFRIPHKAVGRPQDYPRSMQRSLLVSWLLREAFCLAREIKGRFASIDGWPEDGVSYLILPEHLFQLPTQLDCVVVRVVLAIQNDSKDDLGCYAALGAKTPKRIAREPDLPVCKRYADELIAQARRSAVHGLGQSGTS